VFLELLGRDVRCHTPDHHFDILNFESRQHPGEHLGANAPQISKVIGQLPGQLLDQVSLKIGCIQEPNSWKDGSAKFRQILEAA
jgi:hypothetical protein